MSNYESYIDEHNTIDADNLEAEIDEAVEQLMNYIIEIREKGEER
ncbi:hypothetical protein [Billgrantia antri]|nr:hypothetical protein [Halomonas sulfidivorans]